MHEEQTPDLKKSIEELTRQYKMKKQMLDMLPNADANMAQLLKIVEEAKQRMAALEAEWAKVRDPLVADLETKKGSRDAAAEATKAKLNDIKKLRADIASMATQIREKEALAIQLQEEYDKMPKIINCTAYTHRIMDITKQIQKQKTEIKKVVSDVHEVQKAINKAADALARREAVADEVVWQKGRQNDRKPNPAQLAAAKSSYKNLALLRGKFDKLVDAVGAGGKAENTAREFDSKTESLLQRVSGQSVEQMLRDLNEVKAENQELVGSIKQAMGK